MRLYTLLTLYSMFLLTLPTLHNFAQSTHRKCTIHNSIRRAFQRLSKNLTKNKHLSESQIARIYDVKPFSYSPHVGIPIIIQPKKSKVSGLPSFVSYKRNFGPSGHNFLLKGIAKRNKLSYNKNSRPMSISSLTSGADLTGLGLFVT